ncbi:MAG TPA: 30S ribosomal protein S4 [Spirochaetota bacterium]|nr:30S ribosomal protein S4 [Spirochaetota bacterium]HPF04726.1 30S ribosomal protein S4 [Spirochaetota bacterium]HPJ41157.1 30S ribosomal protein S4 [Spirochaetota bacterium]HPR37947.1 30S ribosomal protein S4 [Spirochaetota bacterium]HRX46863.1 30S ribosomal protein S4 [Spirochaetota bacterium]
MAKYTGPRCKLCRREMTPLMLKGQRCLTDKCPLKGDKKYPPGPPRKRRTKMSDYAVQLREKQKIKRTYGLLEKPFRLNFEEANRMKGVTGDNMLSLLERRLDNVIYRTGFASSRSQARQLIQHKHITVNGRVVDIPSFIVREGHQIEIRENFKTNAVLEDSIKLSKAIDSKPEWIEVDYDAKIAKVSRIPLRTDIKEGFNEQLVVELYSK